MQWQELDKCRERLQSRLWLFGPVLRRNAVAKLAADSSAEAVPLLLEALDHLDIKVRATAAWALRNLKDQNAIDRLCELWEKGRDARLRAIVRECRYLAREPLKARVLSSLVVGEPACDAEAVPLLAEALKDYDGELRVAAERALRGLTERDAVDALCRLAVRDPGGVPARICIEERKRPSDPEDACLLLFVTRQLDEYFQEDFEFQGLRQAYDRADAAVKVLVMDVVRGGDRRCLGFFGRRKPLTECGESEIKVAIESALRHRDWPRLFRAFLELPMKYGFPLIQEFRKSRWEPEQADLKALYQAILAEAGAEALPPQPPPPAEASPLFERWLAEGRTGEYWQWGETALVERLGSATPPEGVKIVAALAGKTTAGSAAAQAVENSSHWLVRLAGYAVGLCGKDLTRDEVKDSNYWVNELVRSVAVLDFWPVKATPPDLEKLNAAPREAFIGKYGAVRRVLRLLMAHRVTAPVMTEVVFEAGEFAGEFMEA
jgi:HEAT repeat protein